MCGAIEGSEFMVILSFLEEVVLEGHQEQKGWPAVYGLPLGLLYDEFALGAMPHSSWGVFFLGVPGVNPEPNVFVIPDASCSTPCITPSGAGA